MIISFLHIAVIDILYLATTHKNEYDFYFKWNHVFVNGIVIYTIEKQEMAKQSYASFVLNRLKRVTIQYTFFTNYKLF